MTHGANLRACRRALFQAALAALLSGCIEGDETGAVVPTAAVPDCTSLGKDGRGEPAYLYCDECEPRSNSWDAMQSVDHWGAMQSVDGQFDTFLQARLPPGAQGIVTAQYQYNIQSAHHPGAHFPAGSVVGMVHSIGWGDVDYVSLAFDTSLQHGPWPFYVKVPWVGDRHLLYDGSSARPALPTQPKLFLFTAEHPFNTIEIRLYRLGGSGTADFRIHEICVTEPTD